MPLKKHVIEKLGGVATNPAEGVAQDAPHKLVAEFDKVGGYRAFPTVGSSTSGPPGSYAWIGTGPDGWGGVNQSSTGAVQLFNGNTRTYTAGHSPGSAGVTAWIEGAGALTPRNGAVGREYTYYDIDGNILADATWSSSLTLTAGASAGGSLAAGDYEVYVIAFAQTAAGRVFLTSDSDTSITVSANDQIDVSVAHTASSSNVEIDVYLYDPASDTVLYVNTLDTDSTPATATISDVPVSQSAPIASLGFILLDYAAGSTTVTHKRRMYGLKSTGDLSYGGIGRGAISSFLGLYRSLPPDSIVYSELGYVDVAGSSNWFQINSAAGGLPTALASSPAGLLVFYETSTYLVRGDPDASDFQIQLLSGTIGADSQSAVATMGGVVFAAFQGEVFSIALGMGDVDFGQGINNITLPVFDPTRDFNYLGVDYFRRHLVAHETSGRIFRYDIQTQQWLTDPLSGTALAQLVSTPGSNGVIYISGSTAHRVLTSTLGSIEVDFDALDCGDKNLMKLWRRVEVFTDADYAGSPTMGYTVRGSSGTVSGVDQGDGRWVFTFGRGVVGATADLEFTFPSPTSSTVVEPPLVIEYAPRYRER